MSNALEQQVGGTHYKDMKMQPAELAYKVGGSPMFCKLAKYLTRDKGERVDNLNKALHCIALENEMIDLRCQNYKVYVTGYKSEEIREFCNQFEPMDGAFYNDIHTQMIEGQLQSAADELREDIAIQAEYAEFDGLEACEQV